MRKRNCGACLLFLALLTGCESEPGPEGRRASVFSLKLGECLNDLDGEASFSDQADEVGDMRRLDCRRQQREAGRP